MSLPIYCPIDIASYRVHRVYYISDLYKKMSYAKLDAGKRKRREAKPIVWKDALVSDMISVGLIEDYVTDRQASM